MVYFDIKGRAEVPRLVLHAAKIEFEDQRIQFGEWPALKPSSQPLFSKSAKPPNLCLFTDTLFGSLPFLEYDGETIGQSMTIARFLAKKAGLMGRNDLEEAQISMVVDHVADGFASENHVQVAYYNILN